MDTNTIVEFRAKEGRSLGQQAAEEVGPEIHALIQESADKEITPQDYLNWARSNPESASHKHFTWEDTVAAKRWRVHEARNIINSVEIKIIDNRGDEEFVPAFLNIVVRDSEDDWTATRVYSPFEVIADDEEKSKQIVERAMRDFMSWRKRYHRFRTLLPLADVYDATDSLVED